MLLLIQNNRHDLSNVQCLIQDFRMDHTTSVQTICTYDMRLNHAHLNIQIMHVDPRVLVHYRL
jgi:hypothetical protein